MSASRGPRPSVAPKPKVRPELNGNLGKESNGVFIASDVTLNGQHREQNGLNKGIITAEQCRTSVFGSPRRDLQNVSRGLENREATEEERKTDREMIQKMDEDWRLSDGALTDEVDSLETLWVSTELSDSKEAVDVIDTDLTEDMETAGCDAGEALADTDGLSVEDISVNSIDEAAGCSPSQRQNTRKRLHMRKIDGTDKSIQSVTDEPGVFDAGGKERSAPGGFLSGEEEKEEEPLSDCGITCNILKLRCGCKSKEKGERLQNISFYDFVPEDQKQFCDATKGHAEPIHEPYYVTSDSIIITQSVPSPDEACGSDGPSDRPRQLSSVNGSRGTAESCVETANGQMTGVSTQDYIRVGSLDKKKLTSCQKRLSFRTEEANGLTVDGLLPQFDHQPRFRLVSISVPTDTDTSLTSSLSESQLLSPNDSLDGFRDEDELEGFIVPLVDNATDMEQDSGGEPLYEQPGNSLQDDNKRTRGMQQHSSSQHMNTSLAHNPYISGLGKPALSSSPVLNSTRHKSFSKPHYLSLYPRSMSMETHDVPVCVYRDRDREAVRSSGSFSRCSPLSSSGLSTPTSVVDIPPPFELAYITKKPITKSSPSLLIDSESTEKNRKKKSSLKHFLMLKFRRKTENKSAVDVNPSLFKSSTGSGRSSPIRQLEAESRSLTNSPRLDSRSTSQGQGSPASSFLYYKDSRRKGSSVAFLNRSVIRVESFEDRTRAAFVPLPLTKPRSISFPNTGSSDYENVPPVSSDYENVQVPHRRTIPQGPFPDFFPSRVLSSGNDTDGYVDMSSLPGFKSKLQLDVDETERYVNRSVGFTFHISNT